MPSTATLLSPFLSACHHQPVAHLFVAANDRFPFGFSFIKLKSQLGCRCFPTRKLSRNGLGENKVKTKLPEIAIVNLSSNADKYFVEQAEKIGARAYVVKTKAAEALVTVIERAIFDGEFV